MKAKQVLNTMKIVSWIVFVGLCIRAGSLIVSYFISVFVNKAAITNLFLGLDLSRLYEYSITHYNSIMLLVIVLAILKAYMFFLVLKLFAKLNLDKPFTFVAAHSITKISFVSLLIGAITIIANGYNLWLIKQVFFPVVITEGKAYLFLGAIILIVAFIFRRGIEIQEENELTI